jgi:outer membrane protein assembly factor BamB
MSEDTRRSRREVLALAGGVAATVAGCTSVVSPPESPPSDSTPSQSTGGAKRPDTIFRADVARTGYWPDQQVPLEVGVEWSVPGINKGDHTAAKPSPLAYRGDIIVPGDVATIFSYTPAGELNWSTALHPSTYGTHATPAIADGRLFTTGYDGAVYGIETDTGEIAWRTTVSDAIGSSPNYYDGRVYIATEFYTPSGGMTVLDATTGEVLWEDNRVSNHAHSQTGIDVDGRAFAAGSNDGNLYVWDLDSWEFRGTFSTGGPIKGPVCMRDGVAIFGSWDDNVYAVDTESLDERWAYETGENVMAGAALHPGTGTAVVGSGDHYLHAIDVETGEQRWTFETNAWIIGSPVVAGDTALVGDYSGSLHAVDATDGTWLWEFDDPDGYVTASPAVVDGDVYITERATSESTGRLYKLSGP